MVASEKVVPTKKDARKDAVDSEGIDRSLQRSNLDVFRPPGAPGVCRIAYYGAGASARPVKGRFYGAFVQNVFGVIQVRSGALLRSPD